MLLIPPDEYNISIVRSQEGLWTMVYQEIVHDPAMFGTIEKQVERMREAIKNYSKELQLELTNPGEITLTLYTETLARAADMIASEFITFSNFGKISIMQLFTTCAQNLIQMDDSDGTSVDQISESSQSKLTEITTNSVQDPLKNRNTRITLKECFRCITRHQKRESANHYCSDYFPMFFIEDISILWEVIDREDLIMISTFARTRGPHSCGTCIYNSNLRKIFRGWHPEIKAYLEKRFQEADNRTKRKSSN